MANVLDPRKTGDSKMQRPMMPSTPPPPRELHPAAADAVARYSRVWEENDRLAADNVRLTQDNEVLKRIDAEKTALISDLRRQLEDTQQKADDRVHRTETHFRERLAESERIKERYLRFAVSISER